MINNKTTFEERQLKERNKTVFWFRMKQCFDELKRKSLKRLLLYTFIATTLIIWNLFIYKHNNLDLSTLFIYFVYWSLDFLILFFLMYSFGTPRNYQKIEDDIKDIFDIKEAHKVPALKSNIRARNGKDYTYCFYSPDFSKEKYEEKRTDIEQKLGIKILGHIVNENEYVYVSYVPNKKIKKIGELTDDRI